MPKSVAQSSAPLWPLEAWRITHQLPLTSTSMNTQSFTSYFTRSLSATSPSLLHSFVSLLPPLFLFIPPSLTPSIHLCCAELFNQTQEYLKPFPIKTPPSFRNLGGANFLDLQKGLIHTASKDHRGKRESCCFFSSLLFFHF